LEEESLEHDVPLISTLKTEVQEAGYDVVIIDPLMEAYPVKDENDNALANTQMLAFRQLARSTQAAVVVIHNSGLRSSKKGSKFLGRGATARVDRADVTINLTVDNNQVRHFTVVKARSGNLGEEMRFKFAQGLDYILLSAAPPSQTVVTEMQAKIIECMRTLAGQGTCEVERKTIIEKLGISTTAAEQALDRALNRCLVSANMVKAQKGVYALTPSATHSGPTPAKGDQIMSYDKVSPVAIADGKETEGEPGGEQP